MATKPQPATRIRTCRACGVRYEYPLRGEPSTRHHCPDCVSVPPPLRKVCERLLLRVQKLEREIARLKPAPSGEKTAPA